MPDTEKFRVKDCLGHEVYCSHKQWEYHVLDHPEMFGCEDEVIQTIQNPSNGFIFQDREEKNRKVYYRLSRQGKRPLYIKVIVEFDNNNTVGKLITAYKTSNVKAGEKLTWTC